MPTAFNAQGGGRPGAQVVNAISRVAPTALLCGFTVQPKDDGTVSKIPLRRGGLRGVCADTPPSELISAGQTENRRPPGRYWGLSMHAPTEAAGGVVTVLDLDRKRSLAPCDPKMIALLDLARNKGLLVETSYSGNGEHIIFIAPADPTLPAKIALGDNQETEIFGQPSSNGVSVMLTGRDVTGDIVTLDCSVHELLAQAGIEVPTAPSVKPPAPSTPSAGDSPAGGLLTQLLHDLGSALEVLDADDRTSWIARCHELKVLGEPAWPTFDKYSQKSPKYDAEDARRVWDSAKPTSTGYAAIFAEAQRLGWKNPGGGMDAPIDSASIDQLEANIVRLDDLSEKDDEPMPHVVECLIPFDEVTLGTGHGGTGKSFAALNMGIQVALGKPFGALATRQVRVLFFSGEDSAQVLRKRVRRLCRALNVDPKTLEGKLFLLDASDIDTALHREQRVGSRVKTETPLLDNLAALVEKLGVGLVIVDNASDTFDDDEIKRVRVRMFVRSLRTRIARPGRAVLLLAHINKASANNGGSTEDYSGSTAWHNSVRSRLSLIVEKDGTMRIEHQKANHGAKAAPVKMEWVDGAPLIAGTAVDPNRLLNDAARKANERARDDADKRLLVSVIQSFDQRGEKIPSTVFGRASAYNTLKSHPDFPKVLDADRFVGLIRELEVEGIVRRYPYKHDYKPREGLTCDAQVV